VAIQNSQAFPARKSRKTAALVKYPGQYPWRSNGNADLVVSRIP
jgi:hypothetical protein